MALGEKLFEESGTIVAVKEQRNDLKLDEFGDALSDRVVDDNQELLL